ncbi:hypothetical protein C8R43DRAFT_835287, partial [Mycena crocata]
WKAAEIAILVHVLGDEKKLGRQAESGWASESYTKVAIALKLVGVVRDNRQIKSCWTRIKGLYKIFKSILLLSGFGWDVDNHCVTAEDEVWDAYLEAHPKHKSFRDRTFVHYDAMALLCDDVMATGEDA